MLYGCYNHEEDHVQYESCDSGVCSKKIIYMFLVGLVSRLVENFNIGIFSYTIKLIKVKLCMMVQYTELIPVLYTFNDFNIISR